MAQLKEGTKIGEYLAIHAGNIASYIVSKLAAFGADITLEAGDEDRFIVFKYTGGSGIPYSWRIGYLGSGSGDAKYLSIQSGGTGGVWEEVLHFGLTTKEAAFAVTPKVGGNSIYHEGNPPVISGVPTGSVTALAAAIIPSGWLECDGSAVSRTTYVDLYSAIGDTYGSGDGSTTFNLPDMKGKVIVGYDSAQTEFDVMGKSGGEKTHQLTIDEMPSHNHTLKGDNDSTPDGGTAIGTDDVPDTTLQDASCGYTGGDQPHNNLQPYITLKWIIKA